MALYCQRALMGTLRRSVFTFGDKLVTLAPRRSIFTLGDRVVVAAAVERISAALRSGEVPEPEQSGRLLVSQVLGYTSPTGYTQLKDQVLEPEELRELNRMVSCRLARVPVQYIVGTWDFRQLTLKVRPPVFIPRPETEQLVQIVLDRIDATKPLRLLEVGPGSGNICLSLLRETENLTITALERSQVAANLTRENARDLGLESRLTVVEARVDESTELPERFDAVVSNPPYVLRKDLTALAPEISLYEDLRALDGGAEGLDVILDILRLAGRVLGPGGQVYLEVDPCHPYLLPPHLPNLPHPFRLSEVIEDVADKERFLVLTKE